MEKLIEVKNVCKTYAFGCGEVHALSDISLSVYGGEFMAIIGQSGSGKSTLMNIIGCLDTPTSGKYFLDGESVDSLKDNRLSVIRNEKIGFIFQGFNLIPSLTAAENVELPLSYRKIPKQKRREIALEALCRVGLDNRVNHLPSQMSGGQQQRVAIARAIAASPPIILADEPTGNLDSRSGSDVMQILLSLHREGHTIVLITHDSSIASTADRVVSIADGRLIG